MDHAHRQIPIMTDLRRLVVEVQLVERPLPRDVLMCSCRVSSSPPPNHTLHV